MQIFWGHLAPRCGCLWTRSWLSLHGCARGAWKCNACRSPHASIWSTLGERKHVTAVFLIPSFSCIVPSPSCPPRRWRRCLGEEICGSYFPIAPISSLPYISPSLPSLLAVGQPPCPWARWHLDLGVVAQRFAASDTWLWRYCRSSWWACILISCKSPEVQRSCAPSGQRRCRLHTNGSIIFVSQVLCPPLMWILNSLFWLFNVCPNPSVTCFPFILKSGCRKCCSGCINFVWSLLLFYFVFLNLWLHKLLNSWTVWVYNSLSSPWVQWYDMPQNFITPKKFYEFLRNCVCTWDN
jgi:hypothetical protein